jgi:plastocyanin
MRKLAILGIIVGALVFAACGGASSSGGTGSATITMGGVSFTGNTTVTITAGEAVTFDDSGGGTHKLVTGTNGTFSAEQGAPSEFATKDGILFNGGGTKTVTFANPGTYHITCTFHANMQATITVQ